MRSMHRSYGLGSSNRGAPIFASSTATPASRRSTAWMNAGGNDHSRPTNSPTRAVRVLRDTAGASIVSALSLYVSSASARSSAVSTAAAGAVAPIASASGSPCGGVIASWLGAPIGAGGMSVVRATTDSTSDASDVAALRGVFRRSRGTGVEPLAGTALPPVFLAPFFLSVMALDVEAKHALPPRPVVGEPLPDAERVADALAPEHPREFVVLLDVVVRLPDGEDDVLLPEQRQ